MKVPSILTKSHLVSQVAKSTTIDGAVGLAPRSEAALTQFIGSVTSKGSPEYHRYLAKGEFARRFGPTQASISAVEGALAKDGLEVGQLSPNHLLLSFSGSASKVEAAFHTGLANYRLPGGKTGRAATSPVELPAAISSKVTVVAGLDDLVHAAPAGLVQATRAEAASHPAAQAASVPRLADAPQACGDAQSAALQYGGLTDDQIANAYGAFGLYGQGDTGQGQSIAVYELEPFSSSDIATFDQCYFGAAAASQMARRLHTTSVDGGQPAGSGSGESLLDIEDVSAMAPGANIDVYEAPNTTFGSLDEYNQIVSNDSDQIVTSSWGLCEAAVQQGEPGVQQEENVIFQQAAAQGQSVFAAAGDNGSDDCNTFETSSPVSPVLSVDDPGSQPYVTSVGGVTMNDATQPPQEQVWNDGADFGAGGGGISDSWVMPSWQAGATVPGVDPTATIAKAEQVEQAWDPSNATAGDFCQASSEGSTYGGSLGEPCREVPDVSAQADEFTGAVTVYSALFGPGPEGWSTIGGTSSATPIWASMLALVNASPSCQSNTTTENGVGFVSPLLYSVASNPTAYAASFTDVTSGNNDMYDLANGAVFPATSGYDMASGLGSPQLTAPNGGDGLAYYLCSYSVDTTRPTVSSLDPDVIPTDSPGSFVINGSGFQTSSGADQVAEVWVNNLLVPRSDYQVTSASTISVAGISGADLVPTDSQSDGAGPAEVSVTLSDGETSQLSAGSLIESVDDGAGGDVPAVTGVTSYGGSDAGGNSVTVLGSGFSSSVNSVTFGGVPATSFKVDSPDEITATVPAYSSATRCATSLDPASDLCQTEVVVSNQNGSSQQYKILPAYEGAATLDANGVVPAPSGCDCEVAPAPSEYDYFPSPRISGISTSDGPSSYADEDGSSTVTITGSGFNYLGLEAVFFGPLSSASSEATTFSYVSASEIQIQAPAPADAPTVNATSVPVTVESLGGTSNPEAATYAGMPEVSSVSPNAAPDSGGRRVTAAGDGFDDVTYALLSDTVASYSLGTVYQVTPLSDTRASFLSPQMNPAKVAVELCSNSGCSQPTPDDSMVIYPPGNPVVTSAGPHSGPAHGGTEVTIEGQNLGCAVAVYFGKTLAETFANTGGPLDCGSTSQLHVTAPPGAAGSRVAVQVETVESVATRYGRSKADSGAMFSYTTSSPSAPRITRVTGGVRAVSFAWAAPSENGGSAVRFYVVRAIATGFAQQVKVLPASARAYTFKGLSPGVRWTVMVTAHNARGTGLSAVRTAVPRA